MLGRVRKEGFLVEIITAKMLVEIPQNSIVLDKWNLRLTSDRERESSINRVSVVTGVSEKVAGRDCRRVWRGQRREEGVTVGKENAALSEEAHRWSVLVVNGPLSETIRNEQDNVTRHGQVREQQQKQAGQNDKR